MYCVHAPVLHPTGERTCAVTTHADEFIEWKTPTVRWNAERSRLEILDERGERWMETLRNAERDVLFAFHRSGYGSVYRPYWSDLRRWLASSVDESGKSLSVTWKEPMTHHVLLRAHVRLEKLVWGTRSSLRVCWTVVPDAVRCFTPLTRCLFLPDQVFLFANEVDQLLSLASGPSSSASLKKGSSDSSCLAEEGATVDCEP